MLDQDQNLLGRSPADRFVYKVPVCKDVRCGYTGEVFERKYRDGCVFRDTLERDQGELSYPKIVNGKPSVYSNKENCIWHIQASSPNKWLKIKITRSHIEYDEHCGLDKLHIFPGPIPKGGFPIASDPHPVARICGGSLGPPKNAEGKGPKKYHKSFHDGTAQLTRYVDNTCPIKKNKRTKKAPERTPCKQEGWDSWIFLPGNNVTFAFDSDQSKQATGFTVLWSTYDSPKPTPPPPDVKKMSPVFAKDRITNELRGREGLFRMVKINTAKHSQQAIYRSRVYINWERLKILVDDKSRNLPKCKKFDINGNNPTSVILPKPLAEEVRDELQKGFYQEKAKVMLELYQKILDWAFSECYGPEHNLKASDFHNKIARMIALIYGDHNKDSFFIHLDDKNGILIKITFSKPMNKPKKHKIGRKRQFPSCWPHCRQDQKTPKIEILEN